MQNVNVCFGSVQSEFGQARVRITAHLALDHAAKRGCRDPGREEMFFPISASRAGDTVDFFYFVICIYVHSQNNSQFSFYIF